MPPQQQLLSQMYLKIGGANASEAVMDGVISIEVDDSLLLPDMFSIRLRDPSFRWTDSADFALGKPVEISAADQSGTKKLLSGEITAVEPEFSQADGPTVVIRGYDQSHRLHRTRQTRTYLQSTDADIARKVAADSGLKAKVDSTREVHKYVCQDNQTNMEFLQDRAQRIGYRLFVEDGTLNFCKASSTGLAGPVLEWGTTLLDFQARLTSAQQVTEVIVHGWDPKTKKEIIGKASTPQDTPKVGESQTGGQAAKRAFNVDTKETVVNRPVATQAEAEEMAQAVCDELGNSFIQAEGRCLGNPGVTAGTVVELKGIGRRFSGKYRITHSLHLYDETGYVTQFNISGRRADTLGALLAPKAGGSKHSVMIGIVTNNKDPEGMGRVKVRFPTLPGNEESDWARLVSPMAGSGRGFEFVPEVNDEVLVAFEHDDTHRPFVLGALWNGKDKPPEDVNKLIDSTGKVQKRIIRSRTGHIITLDDTDGKEKISIVDKTGSNSIEFDSQKNSIAIKAQGDIQLEATGKVKIKGMDIEMEAQANAKLKGSAGVKVEASGTVDIKGAIINLN